MPELLFARVDAALALLDRHRQRRHQQIPTLSVVAGDGDAPARLVHRWARLADVHVCESTNVGLAELVSDWFAALVRVRNLPGLACAWLAVRTGSSGGELWRRLRDRSAHERDLFLDRLLGAATRSPSETVCRAIIEHSFEQGSTTLGLWDRLRAACRNNVGALFAGVSEIVGRDASPSLLVRLPAEAGPRELESACKSLTTLTSRSPDLSAIVSCSAASVRTYLAQACESHALALVREGVIGVKWEDEAADLACSELESPSLSEAAESEPASDDDPARSQAERYLFERLQTHEETAGLFELNGRLTALGAWGGRLEVDLLARDVQVAVEIDGYYHFNDLEAYRRDRRKDVLLQQVGYFVVRCLADDIVAGLEDIVQTIIAAVRRQRASRPQQQEQPS